MGRPRKTKSGVRIDPKTGKADTGRPTVMTEMVIAKLEQAFAIDATVEEACSYSDISRDAFYDYLKRNPKFSDRIDDLRQRPVLKARQTVVSKMDENYSNAMDYLSRKKKAEFSTRQEMSGPDGKDLFTEAIKKVDDLIASVKNDAQSN